MLRAKRKIIFNYENNSFHLERQLCIRETALFPELTLIVNKYSKFSQQLETIVTLSCQVKPINFWTFHTSNLQFVVFPRWCKSEGYKRVCHCEVNLSNIVVMLRSLALELQHDICSAYGFNANPNRMMKEFWFLMPKKKILIVGSIWTIYQDCEE